MKQFQAVLLAVALVLLSVAPASAGTIEAVLFTKGDGITTFTNTFKSALIGFIKGATTSIDVAIYNLRDADVITALNEAAAAGKTVRVVTDDENNVVGHPIKDLVNITVVADAANSAIMHHKFIIVDAGLATAGVWVGSANFTTPSFSAQNNNAVIIRDGNVANAYKTEFDRLFSNNQFHATKTLSPSIFILDDGTEVEIRFSPGMNTQTAYANLVSSAASSFYYAIYTFGSSTIANAMIAKSSLSNFGLVEATQTQVQFNVLQAAGLSVANDVNPVEMHHKYMVIDGSIVVTGSVNFTVQGDLENDENSIAIKNNTAIARKYIMELNRISGTNNQSLGSNNFEDTSAGSGSTTTTTSGITTTGSVVTGPNPFEMARGSITFYSKDAGVIRKIEIFDLSGRRIHTLLPSTSSSTEITWDGRNRNGWFIASGMYYFSADAGGKIFNGRFTAIR